MKLFFFSSYFRPSWEPTFIEFFSYIPSLSLLSLHSAPPSSSSPPLPPHSLRVSVHSLCSASFFIHISHFLSTSILSPAEKRFKTDYQNPSTHPQFILWVCELWKQDLSWHQPLTFSEMPPNQTVSGQIRHSRKTSNLAFFKNNCQVHKEQETAFNCLVYKNASYSLQ